MDSGGGDWLRGLRPAVGYSRITAQSGQQAVDAPEFERYRAGFNPMAGYVGGAMLKA